MYYGVISGMRCDGVGDSTVDIVSGRYTTSPFFRSLISPGLNSFCHSIIAFLESNFFFFYLSFI